MRLHWPHWMSFIVLQCWPTVCQANQKRPPSLLLMLIIFQANVEKEIAMTVYSSKSQTVRWGIFSIILKEISVSIIWYYIIILEYSGRYSSLPVPSGVVRVFWECLSGNLVMIHWFAGIYPLHQECHIHQHQNQGFCQVLLIWGCQWKCLAHLGGVSKVKVKCTKLEMY